MYQELPVASEKLVLTHPHPSQSGPALPPCCCRPGNSCAYLHKCGDSSEPQWHITHTSFLCSHDEVSRCGLRWLAPALPGRQHPPPRHFWRPSMDIWSFAQQLTRSAAPLFLSSSITLCTNPGRYQRPCEQYCVGKCLFGLMIMRDPSRMVSQN